MHTTKAFYLWSWFDQALEGIAVHCMMRLSEVFSCPIIQNFVLFQQKGQLKDVNNFQIVLFIHIRGQTKNFTCCIYCLFYMRFAGMANRIADLATVRHSV